MFYSLYSRLILSFIINTAHRTSQNLNILEILTHTAAKCNAKNSRFSNTKAHGDALVTPRPKKLPIRPRHDLARCVKEVTIGLPATGGAFSPSYRGELLSASVAKLRTKVEQRRLESDHPATGFCPSHLAASYATFVE